MNEWKLNAMINKNKNLMYKFPDNWRHPLIESLGKIKFKKWFKN